MAEAIPIKSSARQPVTAAILLAIFLGAGAAGGSSNPLDVGLTRAAIGLTQSSPLLQELARGLTFFGNATFLLPLAAIALLALLVMRRWNAALLLATTIGLARIACDALKYWVARPRPAFAPHDVYVWSQSFPSGHATNTLATLGAIAWICAPCEHRRPLFILALGGAFVIGLTRPLLGVHWTSDIVAGWSLGGLFLLAMMALSCRFSAST